MYNIAIQQNEPYADLIDYLRSQSFFVTLNSQEKLIEGAKYKSYDVAITECVDTIRAIRNENPKVAIIYLPKPIIYVEEETTKGLLAGADMSISKPYSLRYIVACIKTIVRRSGVQVVPDNYQINAYTFVPKERLLILGDFEQRLPNKEAEVLKMLCDYKGLLLPKDLLLRTIWHENNYFNSRALDTHMTGLRKRFAHDKRIVIQNVRNKGFIFSTE